MNTLPEPEWHPWLKLFTIMAIVAGFIISWPACLGIIEIINGFNSLDTLLVELPDIAFVGLPGIALLWSSFHTLKATDYFRRWKTGVSQRDKLIAYVAIYFGVMVTIALFFVAPFMRFLTDSVGGGLGFNQRD